MVYNRRFSSLSRFKSNRRFGSSSGFKRSGIRKYFPTIKKRSSFKRFKRTFKKFPKRKIDFRMQENQLRSAIVSRKFKTFDAISMAKHTSGPAESLTTVLTSSIVIKDLLTSPVLIGHVAEYEQFAVSYLKVKAKYANGKVDSFIMPVEYSSDVPKEKDLNYIPLFQKQTIGSAIHSRKQNFLAHHKKMRTTPWVDTHSYSMNPDAHFTTLLPMVPMFTQHLAGDVPLSFADVSFEVTIYVITKNKKVQSLNAYTGVTERKVDLVQVERTRNENESGYLYSN